MPDKAEIFRGLRDKILSLTPDELSITPLESGIWGALVDFTSGETTVTLVVVLDGTTSMYFSSGGAILGAGKSEAVRKVNRRFLEMAGRYLAIFPKAWAFPVAQPGDVRFYILTTQGVLGSTPIAELDLEKPDHTLVPLWRGAQDVIAQIRLAQKT